MAAAAGYVGIEADGALWLAAAMGRAAEDVAGRAARLTALFEEAGEEDTVGTQLRELAAWLQWESGDVRRRVAVAEVGPVGSAVDAGCTVPWSDPLVRAARAVWSNATRALAGAGNSIARTGQLIWQLVPGNEGWQQAWVNLPVGVWQMATNPVAAVEAFVDVETLNEEGFSYWIGGFVPDAAAYLVAGAGAAKTSLKLAESAADVAEAARASTTTQRLATRLRRQPRRPAPNPKVEPLARAAVEAADKAAQGHIVVRHGPEATQVQQRLRAELGLTPDGLQKRPEDASRFYRWEDAAEALRRAKQARHRKSGRGDELVRFDHVVGEGFLKRTLEYRETTVVRVMFDDEGLPYSAYPLLRPPK